MIWPVCGQRAQYSIERREHERDGRENVRPGMRSGRCMSGAVRRSTMTLIGTTR